MHALPRIGTDAELRTRLLDELPTRPCACGDRPFATEVVQCGEPVYSTPYDFKDFKNTYRRIILPTECLVCKHRQGLTLLVKV